MNHIRVRDIGNLAERQQIPPVFFSNLDNETAHKLAHIGLIHTHTYTYKIPLDTHKLVLKYTPQTLQLYTFV